MMGGADADFGALLRRRRRAVGLTQEELAARAGLSARGIADLERGARRTPRRDTVALLVQALGGSPEDEAALVAAARRPQTSPPVAAQGATDGAKEPPSGMNPGADSGADSGKGEGRRHDMPRDPARHNLPSQPTHLLGRDETVRAVVAEARRADVRLLTLTGPGGIGKTRLAIQVAAELLDDFADGVWFVRLSRLTDPDLVIPTIAQTLGLKEAGGQPIAEALRAHLRERRLALVLDNCEHVVASAPDVADLLAASPALTVLATSRMPLRLRGEREYPVAPLVAPPTTAVSGAVLTPERLTEYPAVALVRRAGAGGAA